MQVFEDKNVKGTLEDSEWGGGEVCEVEEERGRGGEGKGAEVGSENEGCLKHETRNTNAPFPLS